MLLDRFGVLGQRKFVSSSVLVVDLGGIGPNILILLAESGVGRIMVVDHDNVQVSNLHWKVIHIKGRRGTSKVRSTHDAMRDLNPNVSVTAMTEPLTWENSMELVRGNDCVVDTSNNPCMPYMINEAYIMAERLPKTAAMTNSVSCRQVGPISLVSGRTMVTEGKPTVYNRWVGCVCY